jgi:lipopolysaccharide export system protein LptA
MRGFRYDLILSCALLLALLTSGFSVAESVSPLHQAQKAGQGPMVIHSNTLEADDRKGTVTFTGGVEAKRDDFTVYCNKMVVYYEKAPAKKKGTDEFATQIQKIVATENVKIIRAEGGIATGEKAVYYQQDEKLVLTGKPVVKQKENSVEGDRITLFLKENRSVVEGSSDKKVRAVIFPKQDKGQGL